VVVIGVNGGGLLGGDDGPRIDAFIRQTGVTFPVVMDQGQTQLYDQGPAISPYPVDVVIDRDGTIRAIFTEYDADALLEAVNDAL
jgi:peroxiredoxin